MGVRFASVRRFSKSAIRNPNRSEKIPPNPPKIEVFLSIDLEPIWRPGIARSLVIHFGHGGRINTKPKTPPQPHCHSPSSLLPHPSQRPLRLGHCTPPICSYSPALRPNTSAVCPQLRQQSAPPSLQRLPINATSSGPLPSLCHRSQLCGSGRFVHQNHCKRSAESPKSVHLCRFTSGALGELLLFA